MQLQAAIKYEQDDLMNTKALIDQCSPDDADTLVNQSCVLYKEAQAQVHLSQYRRHAMRARTHTHSPTSRACCARERRRRCA